MSLARIFYVSIVGLLAHPGRSFLTVLGVVIGVVAVVLVISLGQGAQQVVLQEVEGLGGDTLLVVPGRAPSGPTALTESILSDSLKERDVTALRRPENVPGAAFIEPALLVSGNTTYQDSVSRPLILGTTPVVLSDILRIVPVSGVSFTDAEVSSRARTVILGSRVASDLFGDADPVGEIVKVHGTPMRVVGVFPPLGQVLVFNADETVFVPVSTAQHDLLNIDHYHRLFVRAAPGVSLDRVAHDVAVTLRELHGIVDPDKDDFFVVTQSDIAEGISAITQALTLFLVALASVSLLVGGVGIMTIMLVAVTERTHEIGLRVAVGARRSDILWQFLIEALLLTVGGGAIGGTLAVGLSAFAALVLERRLGIVWDWQVPVGALLLGVGVALLLGLSFGIYPALRAARKDPIEALRYE